MKKELPIPKNRSQRLYKFGYDAGYKQAQEDILNLLKDEHNSRNDIIKQIKEGKE